MTTLDILLLVALCAVLLMFLVATCSLDTFRPRAGIHSQLTGPDAHARLTSALLALPGVRLIERTDHDVLLSVLPVPSSMERGLGLFVVVRRDGDEVLLLGRGRLPLPTPNLPAALRQLEREARMRFGPPTHR